MTHGNDDATLTLFNQLLLVKIINPSNAAIFSEYVLPNTRALATDPEVLPRATYAQCIAALAQQAKMFLEMTEAMKTEGTFKVANLHDFAGSPYDVSQSGCEFLRANDNPRSRFSTGKL